MTSGLADYYRGIRPRYGGALNKSGAVVVTAGDWTQLLSIGGKGMIYGGYVFLDHDAPQRLSLVKIELDGDLTASKSFKVLNTYNLMEPRSCPMGLLKYDDTNFIYAVGFAYGLTFESGVKVHYYEGHGTTPNVNYNLIYALI